MNNNNNAANIHAYMQGREVLAPQDFDEYGLRHNMRQRSGTGTEYLLSLVGESLWLRPHEYRYLITERQMNRTDFIPPNPQPPVLYLVPASLVLNGFHDGYNWDDLKHHPHKIDDGPMVHGMYQYQKNVPPGPGRLIRRTIYLGGYDDVFLIHYKVTMLDNKTGILY